MASNNVKAEDESTQLNNNPTNYASFTKPTTEDVNGMLILTIIRILVASVNKLIARKGYSGPATAY